MKLDFVQCTVLLAPSFSSVAASGGLPDSERSTNIHSSPSARSPMAATEGVSPGRT